MEFFSYVKEMNNIQKNILNYIDNEKAFENQYLFSISQNNACSQIKHKINEILHLINDISSNHYKTSNFFTKFENLLLQLQAQIKQTHSNTEIFNIFRNNKRILLFLFKNKILIIDKFIANSLINISQNYFIYEISSFYKGESIKINENEFNSFEDKRLLGENDNYICELIRNDSIDDFIIYVNKENVNLNATIEPSIYETNEFLISKKPTLIEYAAFFGSIQILRYLSLSNVELKESLMLYGIHSNNPEVIHYLEEITEKQDIRTYEFLFIESIKCHHNDIARYIIDNFLQQSDKYNSEIICYHNYEFFNNNNNLENNIYDFVKYDYFIPVEILMNNTEIDINKKIHKSKVFLYNSKFKFLHKILFQKIVNTIST